MEGGGGGGRRFLTFADMGEGEGQNLLKLTRVHIITSVVQQLKYSNVLPPPLANKKNYLAALPLIFIHFCNKWINIIARNPPLLFLHIMK